MEKEEQHKMILHCKGCKYEINIAYEYQKKGLFLASSIDREVNIGNKKHFHMLIVDKEGKEVAL